MKQDKSDSMYALAKFLSGPSGGPTSRCHSCMGLAWFWKGWQLILISILSYLGGLLSGFALVASISFPVLRGMLSQAFVFAPICIPSQQHIPVAIQSQLGQAHQSTRLLAGAAAPPAQGAGSSSTRNRLTLCSVPAARGRAYE